MIPEKYAPVLFAAILSGMMSLLVSGISTYRAVGAVEGFLPLWGGAWLAAWVVAFPAVVLVAPLARKAVQGMIAKH
jgi:hypothetical protein